MGHMLVDITPWLLVRKRTIPTERPPLVGEVSTNKISTLIIKIGWTLTSWHRQFYKGSSHSVFAYRPEISAIKDFFKNTLSSWY
jgi:hypothetical protein